MGVATISFRVGPHKDGNGFPMPMGSTIPTMRPRKDMSASEIIKQLAEALEELADTPCCFWACEGPRRPRNMVTCRKCWVMHDLARLKATLEYKINCEDGNKDASV